MIFHQRQWQFLKKSVQLQKISHAYLFCGQKNLGKKVFAIEFVKLINCKSPDFEKRPCQVCESCRNVQKNIHPDLLLIESAGKAIQISQIRKLIWTLSLKPYSALFKAVILNEAHLMNKDAQSCFLKTLEEPKGNSVLILITQFSEMLFLTILSRVQRIKFYPLSFAEIKNLLKNKGTSDKLAKKIASLSMGRPLEALDFLANPEKLEAQAEKVADIVKISNSDLNFRFQYAKDLAQVSNLKEILETWLRYFRYILLKKTSQLSTLNSQLSTFNNYSLSSLQKIIKLLQNTIFLILNTNINKRLALETLLIEV